MPEHRRIECPETQTNLEIDLERTPCGIVVVGCNRFRSGTELVCGRTCAAALDARERRTLDDVDPRVLVVYTRDTKAIADALAVELRRDRLTVQLADADAGAMPPLADYDALVIGCSARQGMHPPSVIDYITEHADELATMPGFLFTIGTVDDIDAIVRATRWRPTASGVFEPLARDRRRFLHRLGGAHDAITRMNESRIRELASLIGTEVPTPELQVQQA